MSVFDDCRNVSCVDAAIALGIPLRRNSGRTAWALCPIHGERGHPSLFLSADRGWYCYGCHRGGDAVRLYENILGVEPLEAAQRCADDFGISYDEAPERSNTITVNARHLHTAIRKRRDAVLQELAEAECNADDAIQYLIFANGMDACADDPEFYKLVEKRSNIQVLIDQLQSTDDMGLLDLLKDYDKRGNDDAISKPDGST